MIVLVFLGNKNNRTAERRFFMEKMVRINQQFINNGKPDFASQQLIKSSAAREYLIAGSWTGEKPKQRPEGTRIVFNQVEEFRAARDVYFAWQDIVGLQEEAFQNESTQLKPERPEEIVQRMLKARRSFMELILFIPWGVKSTGDPSLIEDKVLDRIAYLREILLARKIQAQTLLMPADIYATEVNNQVDNKRANEYFSDVEERAKIRGFTVKPWSKIREENLPTYKRRAVELNEQEIRRILTPAKVDEAIKAAERRSGYTKKSDVVKAAFAYLRERICEAEIVKSVYDPIKVSAVAKNKDNEVDRELPRLYIIPYDWQFPWLK